MESCQNSYQDVFFIRNPTRNPFTYSFSDLFRNKSIYLTICFFEESPQKFLPNSFTRPCMYIFWNLSGNPFRNPSGTPRRISQKIRTEIHSGILTESSSGNPCTINEVFNNLSRDPFKNPFRFYRNPLESLPGIFQKSTCELYQ